VHTWDRLELCVNTAALASKYPRICPEPALVNDRIQSSKSLAKRGVFRTWHRVAGALDREKGQIVRRRGVAPALVVRDALLQAARGNTRVPATAASPATLVFNNA
jgi:hypothetical protein